MLDLSRAFNIRDGKLLHLSLFIFFASWPFPLLVNRLGLFFVLGAGAAMFFAHGPHLKKIPIPAILFLCYFVVLALADVLAVGTVSGNTLGRYLLFALFPVILIFVDPFIDDRAHQWALKGFFAGNMVAAMLNLPRAIYYSIRVTDDGWKFDSSVWGHTPVIESINHVGNYFFSDYFSWFVHP